jgi:pantetheine-phosphate adenylyltransferase
MMKKALFAGSFNPLTLGHLDILERTAPLFQVLILGIASNLEKSKNLFSLKEVEDSLKQTTKHLHNVEIHCFSGLTVNFAKQQNVDVLIRALRSFGDFEWEMSLACSNRKLSGLETLLIFGDPQYAHISSKLVREIATMGGSLKDFVPADIEKRILEKFDH